MLIYKSAGMNPTNKIVVKTKRGVFQLNMFEAKSRISSNIAGGYFLTTLRTAFQLLLSITQSKISTNKNGARYNNIRTKGFAKLLKNLTNIPSKYL